MNKNLRFLIAALILTSIIFLAHNNVAWAGKSAAQIDKAAQEGLNQSGLQDDYTEPGSVKPPAEVVPIIPGTGGTSIGGVCTLIVNALAKDINLRGELLGFDSIDEIPQKNARYLAGVCSLTFTRAGQRLADLQPADGSVKICFAAIPKIDGKICTYDEQAWTILDTTLENLTNCAPATKTGKYVLMTTQP